MKKLIVLFLAVIVSIWSSSCGNPAIPDNGMVRANDTTEVSKVKAVQ